jgi:L-2,4-diaminobutyrate decarboxylase
MIVLDGLVGPGLAALERGRLERGGPIPAATPAQVQGRVLAALDGDVLPEHGVGEAKALRELAHIAAWGSADPSHPRCAAHLHCPPLDVAVAADAVASALNCSLDSWDQGPAASTLEAEVLGALSRLAGFRDGAGAITTGGTESNLLGMLLGRERLGLHARVLCSELAHFSVGRAAWQLGMGEGAVESLPVDGERRLRLDALAEALARGPAIVVATAGSTDFGSIDPLRAIAALVRATGGWLHVDAAYGGGVLFSSRLAPLVDGLAEADSVALDLHKLGWQPVPAGVFLARERCALSCLERTVAYLNPLDDVAAGYPSLLGASLRTTRRLDALKLAVSLRALGRGGMGRMVDCCHDLALRAAERIRAHPRLELEAEPVLTSVVFRYVPRTGDSDGVNAALRRLLLVRGEAVIGRTQVAGAVRLKLTLLNPRACDADLARLLDAIASAGAEVDR